MIALFRFYVERIMQKYGFLQKNLLDL